MHDAKVKEDLKRLYDRKAGTWGVSYGTPAGTYFMRRKIETALSLAPFAEGDHILEVGCANGPYTFELARRGLRVTGVDLSPGCVERATERARALALDGTRFRTADAEDLSPFADNTFDGAVSFSCFRYLPDPEKAARELFRVIKPGRAVVVDFPNKRSPWFTFLKPLLTGRAHIHDRTFTTGHAVSILRNAGFREIVTRRILYIPKSTKPILFGVAKLVNFIGELPPFNHFAAIIVCKGAKLA